MRLVHPLWLLALIPVTVAITAGLRFTRPRRVVTVLSSAALVLLVLALTQPQAGHGSIATVLVLDRSASIDATESAVQRAWLGELRCGTGCRAVQFGAAARLTVPADGLLPGAAVGAQETGLSDALALALTRARAGGRVVVLSDGLQTTGDVANMAATARARHVRVDVVGLTPRRPDAAVTRVQAPAVLHAGDPVSLQLTVRSTVAGPATITLRRDGVVGGRQRVVLTTGDNPYLLSLRAPAAPGSLAYAVSVALPGDRIAADNSLTATVRVSAQPRILVASSSASRITPMLQADGMAVQVITPGRLPTTAGAYAGEDGVVLDDVSRAQLGDPRARALSRAVRSGGLGLLVLGGPHSFSLGAYYRSPLQAALPVTSLIPGSLQRRNIGLELVLDRSGSMSDLAGGVPKIAMAQAAARGVTTFVASHRDQLGIVAFDIVPHTLVPLTPVTPGAVAASVNRRIDGLQADGGTDIYKALAAGVREIEASREPDRHIILMSDGVSEAGSYTSLLPALSRDHITVSTVALGAEADVKLLQAIAKSTGGRFYATSNARELPRIFARETRLSARPVRVRGRIAVTAGAGSPVVASLVGRSLPPLRRNVVTTIKPGAQADLLGQDKGHAPDPALAEWTDGIGRAVTWTPGLSPDWAATWARRPALFQDATRWLARGPRLPALTPVIAPGSPTRVVVDTVANAGTVLDLADVRATFTTSGGRAITTRLAQIAPSRYASVVPGLPAGAVRYAISAGARHAEGELAVPYPAEARPEPLEATPLSGLAAATGGRRLSAGDSSIVASHRIALWWWLALAALLAFLAGAILALVGPGSAGGPSPGLRTRRAAPGGPPRTADRAVVSS